MVAWQVKPAHAILAFYLRSGLNPAALLLILPPACVPGKMAEDGSRARTRRRSSLSALDTKVTFTTTEEVYSAVQLEQSWRAEKAPRFLVHLE